MREHGLELEALPLNLLGSSIPCYAPARKSGTVFAAVHGRESTTPTSRDIRS
jgi:hypothetical protein